MSHIEHPLNFGQIQQAWKMRDTPYPVSCEYFTQIHSTQAHLKSVYAQHEGIHLVISEQQTAGYGRLGRPWYSPQGQNLYFSFSYPFSKTLQALSGLSLAIGLSIVQTIQHPWIKIKWPNDLVAAQGPVLQKWGGILVEFESQSSIPSPQKTEWALLGIGLNVNMTPDQTSSGIEQPWTSLSALFNTPLDRTELLIKILKNLISDLILFEKIGFAPFYEKWGPFDALKDKPYTFQKNTRAWTGIARGIDPKGFLRLEDAEQNIQLLC